MSPLENAIEVLENKNQQLRTLISQCQTRQMQNINPLTMCLNGVIDAAVNGGVTRYQEVSNLCCVYKKSFTRLLLSNYFSELINSV